MNVQINILLNLLVDQYFTNTNCLFIFANKYNRFRYSGVMPRLIFNDLDNISHIIFKNYSCQGFIVVEEKPLTIFEKIEDALKFTDNRFNFRKYLYLSIAEGQKQEEAMAIFKSPALTFVSDVLLAHPRKYTNDEQILNDAKVVIHFYTHKYVGNDSNKIILLNTWFSENESFSSDTCLYPNKLENQFGRELKIATFTYKPYSVADPLDGTEILIALEYARKHNMTPRLIIDEEGQWGEVYDNWTGYGVIGNIATDASDIGLGALYTWEHEYRFLDLSKPTLRTGITCIAPAPTLVGGLVVPFNAFSTKMWIAVVISFLCSFISVLIVTIYEVIYVNNQKNINLKENIASSILETEAMFLLQSLANIPKTQVSRLVYALNLILCIMLASVYSTALASNMTVPRYYGTIRTVEDLAASDMPWGATSVAWISSILGESQAIYKKLIANFVYTREENLFSFNKERFSYSVERLQGGHFAIGSYVTKEGAQNRRLMNEDIYSEFSVIMLKKSSILLPSIDSLILRISQSGIIDIWEKQVVSRNLDVKIQKIVKQSTHNYGRGAEPITLQLSHVEGAFTIWAIGMITSLMIFMIEILI